MLRINYWFIFLNGTIKEKVDCNVTTGISDHQAVILTLNNASFNCEDTIHFLPNFCHAHDESIIDLLDLHYDTFKNFDGDVNALRLFFNIFSALNALFQKLLKRLRDVTRGSHERRYAHEEN